MRTAPLALLGTPLTGFTAFLGALAVDAGIAAFLFTGGTVSGARLWTAVTAKQDSTTVLLARLVQTTLFTFAASS